MKKAFRIRLMFYNNFSLATIVISLFGCYLIVESGNIAFILPVLFMKVITNALVGAIFYFFKQNQLYFFQNLGVSATQLYSFAFVIDMVLWLGVTLITILTL